MAGSTRLATTASWPGWHHWRCCSFTCRAGRRSHFFGYRRKVLTMLASVAWGLAVIAVLLGVYYLIPNVYHVLADDPMQAHIKHAIAFFAVAVVLFLAGRFVRNSQIAAASR